MKKNKGIVYLENKKHWYFHGERLWSPSTMLRMIAQLKYDNVPSWILQTATDFGKKVHQHIELFGFGDLDIHKVEDYKLRNVLSQFLKWYNSQNGKNFEHAIMSNFDNVLMVKDIHSQPKMIGFIDFIANAIGYGDYKLIVEIKTRSQVSTKIDDYVLEILQLLMYKKMWLADNDGKCFIALLVLNKTSNKYFYKVIDYATESKYTTLLYSLLDFYRGLVTSNFRLE